MRSLFHKLSCLWQRRRREAELREELQFHLEEEAEQREAEGLGKEESHWAARRDLGNVTLIRENTRVVWTWTFLEQMAKDVRYALRGFKDHPGFTLAAVLSLALGLGSSLAIYTVADNLLLRPLPYSHSSQLVMLWEENLRSYFLHGIVAPRNYFVWKTRNNVFEDMVVFDTGHAVLRVDGRAEELTDLEAGANLLPMLGVEPLVGRRFTEGETRHQADPVILISFRVWQSWFGGDRNILGKSVEFGGRRRTIVGVLPPNFYFRDRSIDIWSPLDITPAENGGDGRWLWCLARLKPGVSLRQAQIEMSAIARQRAADDPYFKKTGPSPWSRSATLCFAR